MTETMKTPSSGLIRPIAAVMWIVCAAFSAADSTGEETTTDIWQDALIHPFDSIVLTEQQIDRFLARLAQSSPERAAELGKMRLTHPQQFRWEIREEMSQRFFQRIQPPAETEPETKPTSAVAAEPPVEQDEAMLKRRTELVAWLETHFPRQAEELKANPSPSAERLDHLFTRYEPIMRAERTHPPLAEAMIEDITVQMRRDELLMELQYAEAAESEAIIAELEDLVAKRFDLIILKRQLQHDQLHRRLARLQQELDRQKQELDALKKTKDQSVKARVGELLKSVEKADWQ